MLAGAIGGTVVLRPDPAALLLFNLYRVISILTSLSFDVRLFRHWSSWLMVITATALFVVIVVFRSSSFEHASIHRKHRYCAYVRKF